MKKFLVLFMCFIFVGGFANETKLLRFPTMHGNQVVFTYAGDLYTVAKTGGVARKITNDIGFEMFAKFSPDGENIAFTGQMDGNTEVYMIPAEGGNPVRLTYTATLGRDDVSDRMGPNNIVMTWKDNERKRWPYFSQNHNPYIITLDVGLPDGSGFDFSPAAF